MYEIVRNGRIEIVHIEFQRYEDEQMAWRVLEYNVFTTCKYKCPVHSFVIYLKKEGKIAESPLIIPESGGPEIWRFYFTNVKLWEISTEKFRRMQSVGILPLLALTREGGRREVVDEVIARIEQAPIEQEKRDNLLTIAFHLFTLGLDDPADKDWLRKRFAMYRDIIHDTEIYQIILQEGHEKGLEEGIEKGCEAFHQLILEDIQDRFPELIEYATECVNAVTDLNALKKLVRPVAHASSADEVYTLLDALRKNNKGH